MSYDLNKYQKFTPEQMSLLSRLFGGTEGGLEGGLSFLSKIAGGDSSAFQGMEDYAHRQHTQNLGEIGSRFSHLGAVESSGFNQAMGGASGDFASNLSSQRLGMQQSAIERLLGLSQNLLGQEPYGHYLTPNDSFDWGGFLGTLGGSFAGGGGAAVGKQIGSGIAKRFF